MNEFFKAAQIEKTAAVDEGDLALINALARRSLKAEEVYTFPVRLCDNEVDRDFERFSRPALEKLAELFVGKCGIFDHQWTAMGQTARLYKTEVVDEASVTSAGDSQCYLKGWAYMLRGEETEPLIAQIEAGIKKEVSVGCAVARSVCSICGQEAGGAGSTTDSCAISPWRTPPTPTSGVSWQSRPSGRRGSLSPSGTAAGPRRIHRAVGPDQIHGRTRLCWSWKNHDLWR